MIKQCTLWSLDVWGNEEDGFEVNDRYHARSFTADLLGVSEEGDTHEILQNIDNELGFNLVELEASGAIEVVWDSEWDLTIYQKSNDMPLYEVNIEQEENEQ